MLAVTGTDRLQRWDGVAGPWVDVAVPAPGGTFGQVLFLDDTTAVLGTSTGRASHTPTASPGASVSSSPVVGDPVRGPDTYYWLLADGAGVLRSSGLDAATWTAYPGARRGRGGRAGPWPCGPASCVTWGDPDGIGRLISSGDGGTSWVALEPTTPYRPDGLVHAGTATFAVRTDCAAGGADAVVRLADP